MTSRGNLARRATMFVMGPMAVVLGWASLSWACGLYAAQPLVAVSPNRATAPADVTVTGSGWQAIAPISLDLTANGSTVVQPLGVASANDDGAFSSRIRLAVDAPGLYYVSATQGDHHTNIPVEVTGLGRSAGDSAFGHLDQASRGTGLSSHAQRGSGTNGPPVGAIAVGAVLLVLCAALTTVELRRKRASS